MNKFLKIILILFFLNSCKKVKIEFQEIINENYELVKPIENTKKVLILFGGFPEKPIDIKREFNIIEIAKQNNIAVLYMNYNQKLWLEDVEKQKLASILQKIFIENNLPKDDIYFGGFSSGGNVAILISTFIVENKKIDLTPKGVFIIDSPIDLEALYRSSEKNLEKRFSEVSIHESTWLIETLEKQLGNPSNDISKYQKHSVYTSKTKCIDNLKGLKNIKIRLYTEPDTIWWRKNRNADYNQMNAYYIKLLSKDIIDSGFTQVEYIPTKNKGYRANGERHPHSWSIIDKNDLVKWVME